MMDQHPWILLSPHRHFRLGLHPDSWRNHPNIATWMQPCFREVMQQVLWPYDVWSLFSTSSAAHHSLIPIIQSPMLRKGLVTMGHNVQPLRGVIIVMYSVDSGKDYILEKASNCSVVPCKVALNLHRLWVCLSGLLHWHTQNCEVFVAIASVCLAISYSRHPHHTRNCASVLISPDPFAGDQSLGTRIQAP